MSRRALCALVALCCVSAPTLAKKKDPPWVDPATGIQVEWKWTKLLGGNDARVEGKATNTSQKDYRSVSLTFVLWARDGDKIGEQIAFLGTMPAGTKAKIRDVYFSDPGDGDKPERMQLIRVEAY